MYKTTPFFFSLLLATIPVISMEHEFDLQTLPDSAAIIVIASCEMYCVKHANGLANLLQSDLQALPNEAAIIVVAACENKNALRQTCKRFCEFASRRENEDILLQPQLYLTQEALDRYLLYYGALGNIRIVSNLLAKGANPNVCEDNGIPLMHYVMLYGYSEVENMLLVHPDFKTIDFINSDNICFLPMAQSKQPRVKLNFSDDGDALYYAVKNGLYTMVQDVLARNIGVDSVNKEIFDDSSDSHDEFGRDTKTSLYYFIHSLYSATHNGHVNIMKLLLDKGAYVNGNRYGYHIPLHLASQKGHTSAVQLLIDYNANVNLYAEYRYTPLGYAVRQKYVQITKMLLENGANVDGSSLDFAKDDAMKQLLSSYEVTEEDGCVIQ